MGQGMSQERPKLLQHLQPDPASQLQEPLLATTVAFPFVLRTAMRWKSLWICRFFSVGK